MNLGRMRAIRKRSDDYLSQSQRLAPPGGTIAVGGEHFDAFVKGEALAVFLRHLGRGESAEYAAGAARVFAREAVEKWNAGREYQTRRAESVADAAILDAFLLYTRAED